MLKLQVLVLALLTVTTGTTCDFAEDYYAFKGTQTITERVDLDGIETIEMSLGSADVRVVHQDLPQAIFEIKKTCRAKDIQSGQDLMAKVNLTFEKRQETLKVEEVREDKGGIKTLREGWVNIEITLTMPKGLELKIKSGSGDTKIGHFVGHLAVTSGSGDISIGRLEGDANFSTGSGDIEVAEIKGDLRSQSGSGNIELRRIDGSLWVITGSGDILIRDARGDLYAKTASGFVSIRSVEGNIRVTTGSGDVAAQSQASSGEIDINTSSGSVDLVLTHIESVEVDLSTISGSMHSQIPLELEKATGSKLLGSYGDGDLKVRVRTSSGDIVIRQASV